MLNRQDILMLTISNLIKKRIQTSKKSNFNSLTVCKYLRDILAAFVNAPGRTRLC